MLWNTLLTTPTLNLLVGLYKITGDLGISIVLLTIIIRTILLPVVIPSLKNMKKQKDLKPHLDKIKEKYKNDKKKQAEEQMKLFKEHGLNPASGCLSQIPMILVLIALYGAITKLAGDVNVDEINSYLYFDSLKLTVEGVKTKFLYLDLAKPDPYYVLVILAGIFQYFSSKISFNMTTKAENVAKKTPDKKDDLEYTMQVQMLYAAPITTVLVGLSLSSGAVLYILTTSIYSLIQTYFVMGGLTKIFGGKKK